MEMEHRRTFAAPVERVWQALNDPQALRRCVPGCEAIEPLDEHRFKCSMAVKIGPVSARMQGTLELLDVVVPERYRIKFDGQGGAAGFASGEAAVALVRVPEGTAIDYMVRAHVGGKLAQIGSRLVDGAALKLAEEFFARLAAEVELVPSQTEAAAGADGAAAIGDDAGGTPVVEAVPAARPAVEAAAGAAQGSRGAAREDSTTVAQGPAKTAASPRTAGVPWYRNVWLRGSLAVALVAAMALYWSRHAQ